MSRLNTGALLAVIAASVASLGSQPASPAQRTTVVVRLASPSPQPLDGRLLLLIAKDDKREPRFQITATSPSTAQVFGVDVENLKTGDERAFDGSVLGHPLESLSDLPAGDYTVQALLHKVRNLPPRERAHGQAADGSRRRPAVEQRARQHL